MREEYRVGGGELISQFERNLREMHQEVFTRAPFLSAPDSSVRYRQLLAEVAEDGTTTVVIALRDGKFIGFLYGRTLPVEHRWFSRFEQPLDPALTKEWPGRTVEFVDIAIREDLRRRGVGSQLWALLSATRTEERALLSVQPTAYHSQNFVRKIGARHLGRKGPIPDIVPPYWDIFVYPLPRSSIHAEAERQIGVEEFGAI